MIKRRSNSDDYGSSINTTTSEWEMRPGGMMVQKRTDQTDIPVHTIRLRIAFGALRYEISVNSHASFGELKKILTAETGLLPGDQKLIFRGKERENVEYLDRCGVKDRSKVVLVEDAASIERRFMEMRRNAKIQKAYTALSNVSMEVDKLADQVSVMEKSIAKGIKVPEVQITTLTEMLMRQAIKLDSIPAEGEACSRKIVQGKRVQKCVEALDVLKVSNTKVKPVIVTTNWETFDQISPAEAKWELFD